MRSDIEAAILGMYDSIERAREAQAAAGHPDQGARQGITSGKHLDPIAAIIRDDLINAGFHPDEVYDQGRLCTLPGWFRPTKNWDLLALDNGELVSAIELKSINSSFGNNANNRAEESIGSAFDAHTAFDENLLGSSSIPPVMGYVMIVHDCPDSRIVGRGVRSAHFPIDPDFEGASYLDRFCCSVIDFVERACTRPSGLCSRIPRTGWPMSHRRYCRTISSSQTLLWRLACIGRKDFVLSAFTGSGGRLDGKTLFRGSIVDTRLFKCCSCRCRDA